MNNLNVTICSVINTVCPVYFCKWNRTWRLGYTLIINYSFDLVINVRFNMIEKKIKGNSLEVD